VEVRRHVRRGSRSVAGGRAATDRHFTLLHSEGALRWHIGSPTIMAAQLDHLAELTRHPNLRLGVIPWDRPLTMHARHAFRFAELEGVAVFGDQAAQVFERVADDYRTLGRRSM
jgi:hypothetical protein